MKTLTAVYHHHTYICVYTYTTSKLYLNHSSNKPSYTILNLWYSGSDGEESACNAGDPGSIPESGRSSGEEDSYPLQYFCLGNPMDRGAWRATVHGVVKSQQRLSD